MRFTHKPKTFNFRFTKYFLTSSTLPTLVPPNLYLLLSRSHWKCTSCLQKHIIFVCLYVLLSCVRWFHVFTHECFHLISNAHIVRTFESRTRFETFEKWHNVNYRYVSCLKSETSFIWRTGAWFLKPFEERVEENHIYNVVKPNFTVKTGTVYRGCNICYQFFWKMEKLALIAKFETLT